MKKPSFKRFTDWWARRRREHLPVWIGLHALLFVPLVFLGRLSIDSDLSSVLPETDPDSARAEAERRLAAGFGSGFTVLVGHPRFARARDLAAGFAADLRAAPGVKDVMLEIDASRLQSLRDFLFRYRYQLLAPEVRAALERGDAGALAEGAFIRLSGPVSLGALDRLDLDPFLLAPAALDHYLQSGLLSGMALGLRDGVLAADRDGVSWVLVTGRTADAGLSASSDASPVAAIRRAAERAAAGDKDAAFVFSGAPFHSYESARDAQAQISVLSAASLAFVALLLLFLFRSAKPLAFTLGALALGTASGLAAAFLAFGKIHLFTVVFGTSIIGISIDYALNYFSAWSSPPRHKPFGRALAFILPGCACALFTTLASYGGFLFTAFPLLQEMALFSIAGLLSSSLTVACVFPRLPSPAERTVRSSSRAQRFLLAAFQKLGGLRPPVKLGLGAVALALVAAGLTQVRFTSDVQSLYQISPEMKKNEALTAAILRHGSTGVYALVEGKDEEEARRNEERLIEDLGPLAAQGKLGAALGVSLFVPSAARQAENFALAAGVLRPAARAQLEALGFSDREERVWEADFAAQAGRRVDPADFAKLPLGFLAAGLDAGAVNGREFRAVLLLRIADAAAVKAAVDSRPGRVYVDKIGAINGLLGALSATAFAVICVSYVVILAGLVLRYGPKRGSLIVLIPALASAAAVAALAAAGEPFNIFSVMALILIPGMGTDYVIFFTEGRSRPGPTALAVTLSMATTVLSFGLLGFAPIARIFGLTTALGLFLSFVLTPLLAGGVFGRESSGKIPTGGQEGRRPGKR
jgi:predicted exporter